MNRTLETTEYLITQVFKALTHRGIDQVGKRDGKVCTCNVLAHSDGVVVGVENNYNRTDKTGSSYGNYVKIKHNNGYYTLYAHLKYKSVTVKVGDRVSQGQIIGFMGNTGRSSGAHLHFEIRNTLDVRIDPQPYLETDLPKNDFEVYSVYDNVKNKWLPSVRTDKNDYAGNIGHAVSGLKVSGVTYKVHDKAKKKWLPAVTGDSSYAGNLPNDIDAISINSSKLEYRVHLMKSNRWLGWVDGYNTKDNVNGYAGNIGEVIDAIQLRNKE